MSLGTAIRADRTDSEAGFTLIELLIYTVLAVVVLSLVGGVLINSIKVERLVRNANDATSSGQLAAKSITNGVRNASKVNLVSPTSSTQLLRTRSVSSGSTAVWRCQAWYFGAGEIRTTTSSSAIPTPTVAEVATWSVLASNLQAPSSGAVFAITGRRIDLNFQVRNGNGQPVLVSTAADSRQPLSSEPETPVCF